jgi:acetyltransferase-like isoleucine patch superfamily enzyme
VLQRFKRLVVKRFDGRYASRQAMRDFRRRAEDRYATKRRLAALERKVEELLPGRWQDSPHVTVGRRCRLDGPLEVITAEGKEVKIGSRVWIQPNGHLQGPVTIGNRCFVNRHVFIRPGTTIGTGVFIGPFVRLVTDTHEMGGPQRRAGRNLWPRIVVGDGCWLGAGATVLGGVTIGSGSVVAAGAVVNKDVPENVLVAGVPARVIKTLEPGEAVPERDLGAFETA